MNTRTFTQIITAVILLATPAARSQSPASDPLVPPLLDPPSDNHLNRFGLTYRLGFNTSVSFHNLGGFAAPIRTTPSGDPYNYDDGYVYNDVNKGLGGVTWYWGFDAAPNQWTGTPTLVMHRSTSAADVSSDDVSDDPSSGLELTYDHELWRNRHLRVGLETAFGYCSVKVSDSRALSGDVTVTSDAYAIPPSGTGYGTTYFPFPANTPGNLTPYLTHGSSPVGGLNDPLIANTPYNQTLQTVTGGATITGSRHFDANLFEFRLGPYFEVPLSRRVSLSFSGGLALAYVDSTFSFNQTVTIAGVGTQSQSASGSHSAWLPGGYVAGNISVALSEKWALVAGAQFEDVGQYTQNLNGKQATLDLSKSIFVTLGLSYSF